MDASETDTRMSVGTAVSSERPAAGGKPAGIAPRAAIGAGGGGGSPLRGRDPSGGYFGATLGVGDGDDAATAGAAEADAGWPRVGSFCGVAVSFFSSSAKCCIVRASNSCRSRFRRNCSDRSFSYCASFRPAVPTHWSRGSTCWPVYSITL